MAEIYLRDVNDTSTERVDSTHPLPVKDVDGPSSPDRLFVVVTEVQGVVPAVAYTANDAVGAVFSVEAPKEGWITGFKLIDPDDDTLALTAHVYNELFVGAADNAAYTVAAAYARFFVTSATFSTSTDEGSFKTSEAVGESFYRSPTGRLWIQCSTTGTPTIATGLSPILQIGIRKSAGA